jgi:diaminopimelate decarboxylase
VRARLPAPALFVEPGRAIVGPSTLTLYEVGTVKPLPGLTTWVSVDGGMGDNIRPALYDAEHEVALANRVSDADPQGGHGGRQALRVGRPGPRARPAARRPRVGDLLAVAATGPTPRRWRPTTTAPAPGAVLVRDGQVRELLRRETLDDLVRRDVPVR